MATSNLPSYARTLLRASYNNIPFGTTPTYKVNGSNNTVVHQFPYASNPQTEFMGNAPTSVQFEAILWNNGTSPIAQQKILFTQFQTGKICTLVHPSFGSVTAAWTAASFSESATDGGIITCQFSFTITSLQANNSSPSSKPATSLTGLASNLNYSSFTNFVSQTTGLIGGIANGVLQVAYGVNAITNTIGSFVNLGLGLASSANYAISAINGLGYAFDTSWTLGRYDGVGLTSAPTALAALPSGLPVQQALLAGTTILLNNATQNIANATSAATAATTAIQQGTDTVPLQIQTYVEAIRASIPDPASQISAMQTLAGFQYLSTAGTGPISATINGVAEATAACLRRAALSSLGLAIDAYTPSSANDAANVLATSLPLFDAEIANASTMGDSESLQDLGILKATIINDQNGKAGQSVTLVTLELPASIPLLRLAQRVFGDANYAVDILQRNPDIVCPLWSGTSVELISSK